MGKDNNSVKIVNKEVVKGGAPFGGVYFLTVIGAAIYFVSNSEGFWGFIGALLKGLVWPAYAVNRALELLSL
jgi:hypothetical protein